MNNLVSTFVNVWLHPWGAMSGVNSQGEDAPIAPSMIFVVAMGLVSGLITAIVGMFIPPANVAGASKAVIWLSVLIVPLVSFVGSFIGAAIIWGISDGLLRGTLGQYKTSYRILALLASFSPISALLAPIPKVGQWLAIVVNLWATVVLIQGLVIVVGTPKVRTWVTCGLIFGLLFVLGIAARVTAQRQLGGPNLSDLEGRFGGLSDEELNLGPEETEPGAGAPAGKQGQADVDKKMDDMANQAKEGAKK